MKCNRRKTLQAFLDGELPEKKAKQIKDHLAACKTCREAEAMMKSDKDLARETLRQLDPARIPMPALGRDGAPATHARRPWAAALLQSPAAALLMVVLFLTGLFLGIFLRGGAASGGGLEGRRAAVASYFVGGNAVRAVSLGLDLSGYRPLDQPRVILIAEGKK